MHIKNIPKKRKPLPTLPKDPLSTKSTNYYNTFISVAGACKRTEGTIPPNKIPPTVARLEYDLIANNPYKYSSDEVLFEIFQKRNPDALTCDFHPEKQACFRCSPLSKSYGWGFHFDEMGKVAIFGMESRKYQVFLDNGEIHHKTAFSSKKTTQQTIPPHAPHQ